MSILKSLNINKLQNIIKYQNLSTFYQWNFCYEFFMMLPIVMGGNHEKI
ncbi:Hypothetical protein NGK_1986 [Neisseria gonorrhoeae NCCP11945]|uniref:Uncharacterized protein n=1 Tax=Neisseria gonorrhoeae (strain NCCP11945) TaxID=521006 RepID=B4RJD9_NEIG2|nr:Hypothetical protein NGK_1986 [Neisseria gonorrhoeae NCCP11945]